MPEQIRTALALKAAVNHGNGLLEKLLDAFPPDVTGGLLRQASLRDVAAGDIIVDRGVRSDDIGYVLDGTLGMIRVLEDGKRHIVGLLVPTDIYGRLFDGVSTYRIEGLSDARILSFPRAAFEKALHDNPAAERLFLVHLLDEVEAAREWLLLISGRKAVNRLASFLNILVRRAQCDRIDGLDVVRVPMSRKDLAQYLGTRPETLSRAFRELERDGILRMFDPYQFGVVDKAALIAASGDDLTLHDDRHRTAR